MPMYEQLPPPNDTPPDSETRPRALGSLGIGASDPAIEPGLILELPRRTHPAMLALDEVPKPVVAKLQAENQRLHYIASAHHSQQANDQSIFAQRLQPRIEAALWQTMDTNGTPSLALRGAVVSVGKELDEEFSLEELGGLRQIVHDVPTVLGAELNHRGVDDRMIELTVGDITKIDMHIVRWLSTAAWRTRSNLSPEAASQVFPLLLAYDGREFLPAPHSRTDLQFDGPSQALPGALVGAYLLPYTLG